MDGLDRRRRRAAAAVAVIAAAVIGTSASGGSAPPAAASTDFIVGFRPESLPAERQVALEALGLDLVRAVPHLDLVRARGARSPDVTAHPTVASVHGLGVFRAAAVPVPPPNDPGFARQWNLPLIQIPEAWSVSTGTGATVAVLDTGVAYEDFGPYKQAPDLAGTTFVPGRDLVDGDDHPNDDIDPAAADRPAHGTHSAGIIAATTGNGLGQAGVAPGAAIMPVRVLDPNGSGTDDQIAAGIVFAADNGAHVINMSFDSPMDRPMTKAAVAYAASKGVTMVAAVGNTGRSTIGYPAAYPEVIAVGAVRFDKTRAAYSSYGALGDVDLVAPGGDLSVDQNGDGQPDGILAQSMVYATNGFGDQAVQGTSAAAPHVSGVAALLIGSGLATTPAQVRQALEASALDLGPPGPDVFHGAGLVQARDALTAAGAPPAEPAPAADPSGPSTPPTSRQPILPEASGRDRGLLGGITATIVITGATAAIVLLRRRRRSL